MKVLLVEDEPLLGRLGLRGTFRVAEADNRFDCQSGATAALTLKPLED